jgi:hypothetical protein
MQKGDHFYLLNIRFWDQWEAYAMSDSNIFQLIFLESRKDKES